MYLLPSLWLFLSGGSGEFSPEPYLLLGGVCVVRILAGGWGANYVDLRLEWIDQVESLLRKRDTLIQTLDYIAPEVYHLVSEVGRPMDIWSVGIVMCELLHLPFTSGLPESRSSGLPKLWKVYLGRTAANSQVF